MVETPEYDAVCIFCARTDLDIAFNREHVIPQNVGGTLFLDRSVCVECNSKLGAHIDSELPKLSDVLRACDALQIPHDREGILNRHYEITGEADDIRLRFGKSRGGRIHFPEQRLEDGSLVVPETDYFDSLKRDVRRDERLREAGLTDDEITERLEDLRSRYEDLKEGQELEYPPLGLTLRKRSDKLRVRTSPRGSSHVEPLIAKIAYEILYLFGGAEFFSMENLELREALLASIDEMRMQSGIEVKRVEPALTNFEPVHLIRVEMESFQTLVRVAFFGHIEYVLTAKPLSSTFVDQLSDATDTPNLWALDYQQELDESKKSFWAVTSSSDAKCVFAL